MTTNYHTPLSGADLPLALIAWNTRFSDLDSAIGTLAGTIQNTVQATLGSGVSANDAGYIDLSDGEGYLLDADSATPKAGTIRGFWTGTVISGGTGTLQLSGILDGFSGLTSGEPVYVDTTAGSITQTRPSPTSGGSQVALMEMGIAVSATEVLVRPLPIQYQKRNAMADDDTLTVVHHPDVNGYRRNIWAYITETTAGAEATGYADSNQDIDVALRNVSTIRSKLTSWWDYDEVSGTRVDRHGSNDLTDNNTVTSVAGKKGNAADFTRANSEYLSVADNSTVDMGNIDFSMGVWVKLDSKPASMGIMGKWDGDTEYVLYYVTGTDRFQFIVNDGSSSTLVNADALGSPSTGTWYFIMCWHDEASNTINIQVNNGTVNSAAHSTGVKVGVGTFIFGRFSAGNYFDGQMDVPLLAKDLFTTDEKTWLYNSGAGRSYDETADNKDKLSQTFALGSSTDIASIGLWLKKVGSPVGTCTVRIETLTSGEPSGTLADAAATVTFTEASLGTSYAEKLLTFASEFTLGTGSYAIVLSTDRAADASNYVVWGADGSSPAYASGEMFNEVSSSWSAENADAVFSVYETGTVNPARVSVDWWSSSYADMVNRYGDGAGADLSEQTTFKCVRSAGFDDVTVVVEIP